MREGKRCCGGCEMTVLGRVLWVQRMMLMKRAGIKEYSEWPTIPQLYVNKEFIGGCDILMTMHQDGSLAKMLEENQVLVPAEEEGGDSKSS